MHLSKYILACLTIFIYSKPFAQYKEGYYYTKQGTKVEGLLRLEYGGNAFKNKENGDCFISFKASKEEKRVKLTTADICCFVIEKDSFAVIKNFTLNFMAHYPRDFAQVLQDGRIKLYMYYSIVSSGSGGLMYSSTAKDWVIEKNGRVEKLTKKAFKELMPQLLEDYPELKEKIGSKELRFRDTPEIVEAYNSYFASR